MLPNPPLPPSTPFPAQQSATVHIDDNAATTTTPQLHWRAGAVVAPHHIIPYSVKSRRHPLRLTAVNMQRSGPGSDTPIAALSMVALSLGAATLTAPPTGTSFRLRTWAPLWVGRGWMLPSGKVA